MPEIKSQQKVIDEEKSDLKSMQADFLHVLNIIKDIIIIL